MDAVLGARNIARPAASRSRQRETLPPNSRRFDKDYSFTEAGSQPHFV